MWDTIQKSLNQLATVRQMYSDYGIRIMPLPWEYAQELAHFSYLIKSVRPIVLGDFHGIVASPPLCDYYVRESYPIPNIIKFRQREDPPMGSFL